MSLKKILEYGLRAGFRNDAQGAVLSARQVEYVLSRTLEVEYPAYVARQVLPVNYEIDTGAKIFSYKMLDRVGEAKVIEDFASDFPTIELTGEDTYHKIESFGASFNWSWQDLRSAAMANINLESHKANAAREAVEAKLDSASALGILNIPGFARNSNVKVLNKTSTPAINGDWNTATAQEIQEDLIVAKTDIMGQTQGRHQGRDLLLPTSVYALLSKPVSDFDQRSLMTSLKEQGRFDTIEMWPALDKASATGGPRAIVYDRDPSVAELMIPQEIEFTPAEPRSMAFVVDVHMRFAGVALYRPGAVRYLDELVG